MWLCSVSCGEGFLADAGVENTFEVEGDSGLFRGC